MKQVRGFNRTDAVEKLVEAYSDCMTEETHAACIVFLLEQVPPLTLTDDAMEALGKLQYAGVELRPATYNVVAGWWARLTVEKA